MLTVERAISVFVVVGGGYARSSYATWESAVAQAQTVGDDAIVVRFTYGDESRSRQVVWPSVGPVRTDDDEVVYTGDGALRGDPGRRPARSSSSGRVSALPAGGRSRRPRG